MEFSEKIKDLRIEKNISQNQLAKELNINQTTISSWELGKKLPDFQSLINLSKFFKVSSDYLLGLED